MKVKEGMEKLSRAALGVVVLAVALYFLAAIPGCGKKAPPRPPEESSLKQVDIG